MVKKRFALNSLQRAYWLGRSNEIEWGGNSCNVGFELQVPHLDMNRLKASLQHVMTLHPMLRTVIHLDLTQEVYEHIPLPLQYYSYEQIADMEAFLAELRQEVKYQLIPAGKPMFAVKIVRVSDKDYKIFFGIDMIIADLTSMYILARDLARAYKGEELPQHNITYQAYLEQYELYKQTEAYMAHQVYWRSRLDDFPRAPQLPLVTERITRDRPQYVRRQHFIPQKKWEKFCSHAAKLELTPSNALLSLYAQILSAWGGGSRFAINVTTSFRQPIHPDIRHIMGDFTGVILLEANIRNRSLREDAKALQKQLWLDIEHASYDGLEVLKDLYQLKGETRIYPVVFTSGLDVAAGKSSNIFTDHIVWCESTTPQVVLDHQVFPVRGGVLLSWDAMDSAFMPYVVDEMFKRYVKLVASCIKRPACWEEPLLDGRTANAISRWEAINHVTAEWPEQQLHTHIFTQANHLAEQTAVIYRERAYSYQELTAKANEIAAIIASLDIAKGTPVLVVMDNSFTAVATILGILAYGCAYVPVSPDQPVSRVQEILDKAQAQLLFTDHVELQVDRCIVANPDTYQTRGERRHNGLPSEDVAYIIFTSGSTGAPKGVVITHDAAMNTIRDVNQRNHIGAGDRCIALSTLSFDLSVYDLFGLLNQGGSLVIPTADERLDPRLIADLCDRHQVTVFNSVPVFMSVYAQYLIGHHRQNYHLKHIMLSGDWIPLDLHGKIRKHIPNARFISMGGATEASIWSNYYHVTVVKKEWKSIPYGYPLTNQRFYILDEFLRPCPDYVAGKLYIGGRGVAKEYLNEPALTDKGFINHPVLQERLYDTGDYGRYDAEGVMEFLGRQDNQVKVNGYRIELGDVEAAFHNIGLSEVMIVAYGKQLDNKKLLGFVRSDEPLNEQELVNKLKKCLPSYCFPERIFCLPVFPITANGKIDRKKLCEVYEQSGSKPELKDERGVLKLVSEVLGLQHVANTDSFATIGVSSLEIMNLANRLETKFGRRPSVGEMMTYTQIGDLVEYYQEPVIAQTQAAFQVEEEEDGEELGTEDVVLALENISYRKIKEILAVGTYQDEAQRKKLEQELEKRSEIITDKQGILTELKSILGLGEIKATDSFFQLGVSSVEIIAFANRLEEKFLLRPSVSELMSYSSLKELIDFYSLNEAHINDLLKQNENTYQDEADHKVQRILEKCYELNIRLWIENDKLKFRGEKGGMTADLLMDLKLYKDKIMAYLAQEDSGEIVGRSFKLTPIQLAYVVGREQVYELGNVNAHYYIEFQVDGIDRVRIEQAINKVIEKQEGMRTIIHEAGTQEVLKEIPYYHVKEIFIASEEQLQQIRKEWSHHRYPLGSWPMFEMFISRDKDHICTLHFSLDCLILDGWSVRMFMSQVFAEYLGREVRYPILTFREYLSLEKRWIQHKPYYKEARQYWEEHIKHIPAAPAFDYLTPLYEIAEPIYARHDLSIPREQVDILVNKAKTLKVTLSTVICTAYMQILSDWSKHKDLTLNLTLFNRLPLAEGVEDILGDFTNITLLSYYADKHKSFKDQVVSIQEELWKHIEYRSYDGVSLLRQMETRNTDKKAVMPVVFTSLLAGEVSGGREDLNLNGISERYALSQTPQVVLDHQVHTRNNALYLNWDYVVQAFDEQWLAHVFAKYKEKIEQLIQLDWENL